MLGSMYSAVSGLQAHQTKMNVIGNNIANVNTYGFKASRVTFSDVFYQTMTGASSPTSNSGGTNPTQLGYGAKVNSIDVLNTRAGSATTDRALDVYINGDGYIPVKNSDGVVKYTRVGVLSFDEAGNLVDRNGNMVLGFTLDPTTKNAQLNADGTAPVQNLAPIKVDPAQMDKYSGVSIGKNGEITAIRDGDPVVSLGSDTAWIKSAGLNATSNYSGDVTITSATAGTNKALAPATRADGTAYTGFSMNANNPDAATGPLTVTWNGAGTDAVLHYTDSDGVTPRAATVTAWNGAAGNLTFTVPDTAAGTVTITIPTDPAGTNGVAIPSTNAATLVGTIVPNSITLNISVPTKAGTVATATGTMTATGNILGNTLVVGDMTLTVDPAALGSLDLSTLTDTVLGVAGPGPGVPEKIAHMATVKFINADGLSQDGEGYCVETTNSGEAIATIPGNGGTGNFRSGALEMSNVDLSKEFTEMIITQRGFQANTRMITVSDEMLAELVSMKR
ncbi:MAG TPA: flagellar hook-basal body complex protein [Anaerovoracaceae bacterium]|nr:flagellar hook-basal body complex protein [Anaerovoracaceae bacterium]